MKQSDFGVKIFKMAFLFALRYRKFTAGWEADADLGPVISPQAKRKICDLVESGAKEGAKIILDGRDIKIKGYEKGNFVGPTIISDVKVRN